MMMMSQPGKPKTPFGGGGGKCGRNLRRRGTRISNHMRCFIIEFSGHDSVGISQVNLSLYPMTFHCLRQIPLIPHQRGISLFDQFCTLPYLYFVIIYSPNFRINWSISSRIFIKNCDGLILPFPYIYPFFDLLFFNPSEYVVPRRPLNDSRKVCLRGGGRRSEAISLRAR